MDSHSSLFSSSVIRLVMPEVQDEPVDAPSHLFRVSIRHILRDKETNFPVWEDAVKYIRRYIPLESKTGSNIN